MCSGTWDTGLTLAARRVGRWRVRRRYIGCSLTVFCELFLSDSEELQSGNTVRIENGLNEVLLDRGDETYVGLWVEGKIATGGRGHVGYGHGVKRWASSSIPGQIYWAWRVKRKEFQGVFCSGLLSQSKIGKWDEWMAIPRQGGRKRKTCGLACGLRHTATTS